MKPEVTMGQIARRDTVMISPVRREKTNYLLKKVRPVNYPKLTWL